MENYITQFIEIYKQLPDTLGENKGYVALGLLAEVNRDKRTEVINNSRKQASSQEPTEKQILFLKKNGIEAKGLTRIAASEKIAEITRKR